MTAEKIELVNDAEALVRDALDYPLDATLKSDAAAAHLVGTSEVGQAVLEAYRAGELPDPTAEDFEASWKAWVKGAGKALGRKGKDLFMPLRIVMTGRMAGPDIPVQLQVLSLADASDEVPIETMSLAQRMEVLEKSISELPAPAHA